MPSSSGLPTSRASGFLSRPSPIKTAFQQVGSCQAWSDVAVVRHGVMNLAHGVLELVAIAVGGTLL